MRIKQKEEKMKKIWICVLMIMVFVIPALAVSVCAKDSVVTVVLDPSIGGNSYTYNNSTGVWKTVFSYGNVSGVSTCSTVAPTGGRGSTNTSAGTPLDAVAGDTSGRYCWCKMTHPMSSLWAFLYDYGFASNCASNCATICGNYVRNGGDLRGGLFGSVAAANAAY